MRAIDGDALEKYLSDAEIEAIRQRRYVFASALNTICGNVRNFPTIEPERKKGKWIERNPQNSNKCRLIECDQCGFSHIVGFNVPYEHWIENRNFCERCGSDMRGN